MAKVFSACAIKRYGDLDDINRAAARSLFPGADVLPMFVMIRRFRTRVAVGMLCTLAALIASPPVAAHADIEEQIARVNALLADTPEDYVLLAKRGNLHGRHGDWQKALRDLQQAQALAPAENAADLDLDIGIALFRVGKVCKALRRVDNYLAANPRSSAGWRGRSQVNAALGETNAALGDMSRAIEYSSAPTPELYFERARIIEDQPDRVAELLAGIDDGISKLGPLAALLQYAIDIEIQHGFYASALQRISQLPGSLAEQARWLYRRSQVLTRLHRCEEAASMNRLAMRAIEALPAQRQTAPAYAALRREIDRSYAEFGEFEATHCEPGDPH